METLIWKFKTSKNVGRVFRGSGSQFDPTTSLVILISFGFANLTAKIYMIFVSLSFYQKKVCPRMSSRKKNLTTFFHFLFQNFFFIFYLRTSIYWFT